MNQVIGSSVEDHYNSITEIKEASRKGRTGIMGIIELTTPELAKAIMRVLERQGVLYRVELGLVKEVTREALTGIALDAAESIRSAGDEKAYHHEVTRETTLKIKAVYKKPENPDALTTAITQIAEVQGK